MKILNVLLFWALFTQVVFTVIARMPAQSPLWEVAWIMSLVGLLSGYLLGFIVYKTTKNRSARHSECSEIERQIQDALFQALPTTSVILTMKPKLSLAAVEEIRHLLDHDFVNTEDLQRVLHILPESPVSVVLELRRKDTVRGCWTEFARRLAPSVLEVRSIG